MIYCTCRIIASMHSQLHLLATFNGEAIIHRARRIVSFKLSNLDRKLGITIVARPLIEHFSAYESNFQLRHTCIRIVLEKTLEQAGGGIAAPLLKKIRHAPNTPLTTIIFRDEVRRVAVKLHDYHQAP